MNENFVPDNLYKGWIKYRPIANASIVLLDQTNRVLLLQRATGATKGNWEISGGGIEKSETPRETALRELQEEAGIKLSIPIKEIGTFRAVNPDKTDIIVVFLARITNHTPVKLGDEYDKFRWVDFEHIEEYLIHPTNKEILSLAYKINQEGK